ncbi:MAG: hypothetical protein KKF74_00925 [Nanoarchaeota archaeon]|nr:hypothetical protein [Nanoarchaeota archaeon]
MSVINLSAKSKPLEELLKTSGNIIKIGIDLDGCAVDTNPMILYQANEMYYFDNNKKYSKYDKKIREGLGRPLRVDDIIRFRYDECTPLSKEEVDEIFKVFAEEKKFLSLNPMPYAVDIINRLQEFYDEYFMTARPGNVEEQTIGWFENSGIRNYENKLTFNGNKLEIAKTDNISKFIEDRAETALELAENNINVLLLNYPWNNDPKQELIQKINKHPKIERIYNSPMAYWPNIEEKLIK